MKKRNKNRKNILNRINTLDKKVNRQISLPLLSWKGKYCTINFYAVWFKNRSKLFKKEVFVIDLVKTKIEYELIKN
ncbi:MAG: hypothetical protein GY730_05810 [bacterium]|nr:hypothetical protein [bacterium]